MDRSDRAIRLPLDWQYDSPLNPTAFQSSIAFTSELLRNVFFRFESLMVLTTVSLVSAPYNSIDDKWIRVIWTACILLGVCIAGMSLEVLCGNVVMGPGYDRYCHRHVEYPIEHFENGEVTDGRRTLRQVWMFARLCLFSLIAVASAFYASNALSDFCGFDGIDALCPADADRLSLGNRLAEYVQFLYFTTTTFATVGYGDIHPITLWPRVFTMAFQVVGMGMILVLLQLILQRNGWPIRSRGEVLQQRREME